MVTTYPRPSTGASVASRRSSTHSTFRDGDEASINEEAAEVYGEGAEVSEEAGEVYRNVAEVSEESTEISGDAAEVYEEAAELNEDVSEVNQNIVSIDGDRISLNQSISSKEDDAVNPYINPTGEEEEEDEVISAIQVVSPRENDEGSLKQSLSPRDDGDGVSLNQSNQSITPRYGDGVSIHQGQTPRDGLGIILHQNMASEDEASPNQSMSSRDQEEPVPNQANLGRNMKESVEVASIQARQPAGDSARSYRKISSAITSNEHEAPVSVPTTPLHSTVDISKTPLSSAPPEGVPETRNDKEPRQASLLLVGPKGAGKTTLVYRFLDRDEQPKPTLALDYTYGRKPGRVSMVKDVCHLWEVAGGTLQQLVTTVISSCQLTSLTAIIVLDLSRPAHIFEELQSTLSHLRGQIQDAVKKASLEDSGLPSQLQKAAWARVGPEHADRKHIDPLLVPLVIMGGKYDKFQDFEPESKKVVCRALRYMAHTNGAALQFFSSRDAGLVKKAKELMSHFGFGTAEVKSLAQDYNRPLIIPCGSDSLNIIGGAVEGGQSMSVDGWKHAIIAKFPKSDTDAGPRTRLPEDPSKDENYREPDIDNLRAQKDQELERLCREAGRLNQRYADLEM